MSQRLDWARANKQKFIQLQQQTGLPALGAVAHHLHEGFNPDGSVSALLAKDNNGTGLKWAEWEAQYGCTPVEYPTTEWIDGRPVRVMAKFCHCPDFDTWLFKVYPHLLTQPLYQPALKYTSQPFLWIGRVWEAGYATDPAYLVSRDEDGSVGGLYHWLIAVWDDYADTLPAPPWASVTVSYPGGQAKGQLQPDGRTWAPLRAIAEASGATVGWDAATKTATVEPKEGCSCHGPAN